MSPPRPRAGIPARSPGSAGPRLAPAPLAPHDGGNAATRPSTGPPPDYRDGPTAGLGLGPPDSAVELAPERPGTIACWPPRPGTALQVPHHGGAPGPAAQPVR